MIQKNKSTTEIVNDIQKEVYVYLKPLGFRKHGRTFCRFVDSDIAQVINFQVGLAVNGLNHCLWINIGIRIPECKERTFDKDIEIKKYYNEYECNIRCRLGQLADKKDTYYDLNKNTKSYAVDIINKLQSCVIPVFDVLDNRKEILEKRREYPDFDWDKNLILLEESMIYGRMGDLDKAAELFCKYYKKAELEEKERIEYIINKGTHIKGEWYKLPDGGICSLPTPENGWLANLRELAKKLGIEV